MRSAELPRSLLALLLAYCAASLVHFIHNAEFLAEYPNLPAWLTRANVYTVWLAITAIGVVGCILYRRGFQLTGLLVIAIYAAIGFDGLAHYTRAPLAAHSAMMNFTIWLEAAAAALLLVAASTQAARRLH